MQELSPIFWSGLLIISVGTILVCIIKWLLSVIVNNIKGRFDTIDKSFVSTNKKLDDKVVELSGCLAKIEEQIALNEQETEGLSKNISSILREIGEIKDKVSAISTQYESLKSNHAFLRLEYERQGKRLEELERKVNEMYYANKLG